MLVRIDSFFDFFEIESADRLFGKHMASLAGDQANGMTLQQDYEALAAILLYKKPDHVFEIGTYLGVTADFFLSLLPRTQVVSIAYVKPRWNFLIRKFNNSELSQQAVGSHVKPEHRSRFIQLYGDSHKLNPKSLIDTHGSFDMVFIDGDHSLEGVVKDTVLAAQMINDRGILCWHDANPKPRYLDVRTYLEKTMPYHAIATQDTYIGGIACWGKDIERRIT